VALRSRVLTILSLSAHTVRRLRVLIRSRGHTLHPGLIHCQPAATRRRHAPIPHRRAAALAAVAATVVAAAAVAAAVEAPAAAEVEVPTAGDPVRTRVTKFSSQQKARPNLSDGLFLFCVGELRMLAHSQFTE
jgi:hypothetical protein